jgi:hypothetical protein
VTLGSEKSDKYGTAFNLPVTGLNDNVEFLGRQLHVQTEYIERPNSHIVTQVFCRGRVMLSRKSDCPNGALESQHPQCLQEAMNTQHQKILCELINKQARALDSKGPSVQS